MGIHFPPKERLFDGHLWIFSFVSSVLVTCKNAFLGVSSMLGRGAEWI